MYMKIYTEEDFFEGDFKFLYETEDYDASVAISRAICNGKTLEEVYNEPYSLESLICIRDLINETAEIFASAHFNQIKTKKSNAKFLSVFAKHYFKGVELTAVESYQQWVAFVMQRFIYRKGIPLDYTPFDCDEKGLVERFFIKDSLFPTIIASVYGKMVARGYASDVNPAKLNCMIEECMVMYEEGGYISYKSITDWATAYFKSQRDDAALRNSITDNIRLILLIDDEMERRGKSLEYSQLVDAVEYVMLNSNSPLENYKEFLDIYEQL